MENTPLSMKGRSRPHRHYTASLSVTRSNYDPESCSEIFGGFLSASVLNYVYDPSTTENTQAIVMRPNLRLDFVPEYPLESVGTQHVPEALVEEYLKLHDPQGKGFVVLPTHVASAAFSTDQKDDL